MTHLIEPIGIVQIVEDYIRSELGSCEKYENRTPLDYSGTYSLHELAATIYAAGFHDGARSASERERQASRRLEQAATTKEDE